MDYGKYKYELQKKEAEARKKQKDNDNNGPKILLPNFPQNILVKDGSYDTLTLEFYIGD